MPKRSEAWKDLERATAKALGGVRVVRGDNYARSDTDVRVQDIPALKIDCKHRTAGWKHHTFLAEIERKYCQEGDIAVLVTKNKGERRTCVTLDLRAFSFLLDIWRELKTEIAQTGAESPLDVCSCKVQ